ncbi:disease resistance protein RPV1-like [Rosa chinensis]|uniref:disease resistance protein RPV1-like n=1 Tax=Rosa chinensis TaxID=74649 RepID=UPI001AD8EB2E|nr:disease resistance protein RPV1-like [Rosa chinensis]
MFPRIVNMKSLLYINMIGCKRLENFPEIVGKMESLRGIDVSGTAIKEVPSSIGHGLFNLEDLSIYSCKNLTTLPPSIYELSKLRRLALLFCPKLVLPPIPKKVEYCEVPTRPTPTSSSKISHYGKATSSEGKSDYDGDYDDQGNLALFPSLKVFLAGGCCSSDRDFIVRLGCASTLTRLDISGSNYVSLPAGLTKFINLEELSLRGCNRLQEVLDLPPKLRVLDVSDCVSLERISKLTNILKYKDSQMFEWLNLSNCRRLRDNLVQKAETKGLLVNYDHQVEADLFSLFLSSQKSEFGVVFPASLEIPKWFSCQMDFKGNGQFEFDIQVLPNFKWENTGLALCVATEGPYLGFQIFINEVLLPINNLNRHICCKSAADSAHVWLLYIPFDRIDTSPFGHKRPLAPFQCRVSIYQTIYLGTVPLKSCGVHLVMPPNEECMKLSHAWNFRHSCTTEDDFQYKPWAYDSEWANSPREEEPSWSQE